MKLLVADDHPLFRTAIAHTLCQAFPDCEVHQVGSQPELCRFLQGDDVIDLLLLDLHIPEAYGLSGLIHLLDNYEHVPILVVSGNENPDVIHQTIELGVNGFLTKSDSNENIVAAVKTVLAGQIWLPEGLPPPSQQGEALPVDKIATLTPQQLKVLTMVSEGLYNKQIANELNVTDATVRAHVTEIFRKLGVTNRTQAVILFSRLQVDNPQDRI